MAIFRFLFWQPYKPLKHAAIACLVLLFAIALWDEYSPPYFQFDSFFSYFSEYWLDNLPRHLAQAAILLAIGGAIHFAPVVMTAVIVPLASMLVVQFFQWKSAREAAGIPIRDELIFPVLIIALMACLLVIAALVKIAMPPREGE